MQLRHILDWSFLVRHKAGHRRTAHLTSWLMRKGSLCISCAPGVPTPRSVARGPALRTVPPTRRVRSALPHRHRCTTPPPQFCIVSPQMQCSHLRVIRLCTTASRRYSSSTTTRPTLPADDFLCFPRFFDLVEQHALLSAALRKLDAAEPRASRRRRRDFLASHRQESQDHHQWKDIIGDLVVENAFLPDELYHFEEVRSWRLRSTVRRPTSPLTAGPL